MRFWVTGARGLLGQAVCARLAGDGVELIATDRELDVTDRGAIDGFAAATAFTHVIHCAAFTQVDRCETDEAEARRVNVDGAAHVARAAAARGAVCVYLSTDYVFDGTATEPYAEDAPTAPINSYGRSKLDGERAVLAAFDGAGYVVRTSWLFGAGGPSFVATMLRLLAERPEVRVVDDQVGRPTFAPDLAAAVIALATAQPATGIYHFANAGQVSWFGLASAVRELARRAAPLAAALVPITTAEYPTPARRPAWSVLSTARFERALYAPRPWRDALAEHLEAV